MQPDQTLSSATPAIKTYTALITQTGTNIPTAIVLKNDLTSTPTFTRSGAGTYGIHLEGAFPEQKTWATLETTNGTSSVNWTSEDELTINTVQPDTGSSSDDYLYLSALEIRIYR